MEDFFILVAWFRAELTHHEQQFGPFSRAASDILMLVTKETAWPSMWTSLGIGEP